ncbi:MAG: DUF1887 family protein, partial [Anaerolineales bacterium]|nr:DUF1887 family protein [Anaerolineales bacterium]
SDHLFLLVGGNPLPNLVSALLLARSTATIWLLHSKGEDKEPSTQKLAENLEDALQKKNGDWTIRLEPVPTVSNLDIENRIAEILKEIDKHPPGRVGFNYTGGTKPMAIHTYRVMSAKWEQKSPPPVFSYLDPQCLALRIDGGRGVEEAEFSVLKMPAIRQAVALNVDELAALHNFTPTNNQEKWATTDDVPELINLCRALLDLHMTPIGVETWRKWMFDEKLRAVPDPAQYPLLSGVRAAMDGLCGGTATPECIAGILLPHKPSLPSCAKWFIGGWLEAYVHASLRQLQNDFPVEVSVGLQYKQPGLGMSLDLDNAMMFGYQLFALSCMVSDGKNRKGTVKEHLLEVYVRARQLGGDEARVALVCYYDNARLLEQELMRSWDAKGKIRVFGKSELPELSRHLADWLRTTNL